MFEQAIKQWAALADEEDRAAEMGITDPKTAKFRANVYRRTVRALEIQRDTGIAVCSCCHKPFGDEKPYWMRGDARRNKHAQRGLNNERDI
jgi:hypothetical protein